MHTTGHTVVTPLGCFQLELYIWNMSHFPTFLHTAGKSPWLYVRPASVPASDPQRQHHTRRGVGVCVSPQHCDKAEADCSTSLRSIRYQTAAIQPPSFSPCSSMQSHLYAQTLHLEEVGGCVMLVKRFFALCIVPRSQGDMTVPALPALSRHRGKIVFGCILYGQPGHRQTYIYTHTES